MAIFFSRSTTLIKVPFETEVTSISLDKALNLSLSVNM